MPGSRSECEPHTTIWVGNTWRRDWRPQLVTGQPKWQEEEQAKRWNGSSVRRSTTIAKVQGLTKDSIFDFELNWLLVYSGRRWWLGSDRTRVFCGAYRQHDTALCEQSNARAHSHHITTTQTAEYPTMQEKNRWAGLSGQGEWSIIRQEYRLVMAVINDLTVSQIKALARCGRLSILRYTAKHALSQRVNGHADHLPAGKEGQLQNQRGYREIACEVQPSPYKSIIYYCKLFLSLFFTGIADTEFHLAP